MKEGLENEGKKEVKVSLYMLIISVHILNFVHY